MNRLIITITIGYLLTFSHFLKAYELGAWYKRAPEIPRALNTRFQPSFLILKAGIFSTNGSLKIVGEPKDWKKLCSENYKLIAWLTHRLKKGQQLTSANGENLAREIAKNFSPSCFQAIELDIEPLTGEEPWLVEFLTSLKKILAGSFELRMAIPLVSEEKIAGASWKKENVRALLSHVDGIDLMLYDSGSKTKETYAALLNYNLTTAKELLNSMTGKSILVGIPAYHDRTALHKDNFENINAFISVLKSRTLAENSPLCTGQIRMALYAGWTLSPEDRNSINELKAWLEENCKKDM